MRKGVLLTVSKLRDDVADNKGSVLRERAALCKCSRRRTDLPRGRLLMPYALSEVEKKRASLGRYSGGDLREMLGEVFLWNQDSDGSAEHSERNRPPYRALDLCAVPPTISSGMQGGQYNPLLLLYDGDRLTDSRKKDIKNSLKMGFMLLRVQSIL